VVPKEKKKEETSAYDTLIVTVNIRITSVIMFISQKLLTQRRSENCIISDKFCASHVVCYFWDDKKLIITIICKTFTVVVISSIRTRTGFDPMAISARASHRNPGFTIIVCHCWIIVLCYLN